MQEHPRGEHFPGSDLSSKESKEDSPKLPIHIYVVETRRLHENHVTKQGFGFSHKSPLKTEVRYIWEGRLFGMPTNTKSSMSYSTISDLAKNFAEAYRQHQPPKNKITSSTATYEFRFTPSPDVPRSWRTDTTSDVNIRELTSEEQAEFIEAFRLDNRGQVTSI